MKKKIHISKADEAYNRLEEMIVTLEIKPGTNWTENELSELIGIGRMPVRESLKRLERSHLLTVVPRHGIHINEISIESLYLQMEVRRILERLIARRAARFSTPDERKNFLQLARDYEEATSSRDTLGAVRIDNEFNLFIADCARNKFAKEALQPLHALARRIYFMQYETDPDLIEKINNAHCSLMRVVASGDEKLAAEKSDILLDYVETLYKQTLNVFI